MSTGRQPLKRKTVEMKQKEKVKIVVGILLIVMSAAFDISVQDLAALLSVVDYMLKGE